jgi:DNA-binding NarL/FixJ family response regulator
MEDHMTTERDARPTEPLVPTTSLADAGAALAERPYVRRGAPVADRPIRVVLADDHAILRSALKAMFQRLGSEIVVVGEAANGQEAVQLVARLAPDVLVMDLDMPGGDGLTATKQLMDQRNPVKILILTMHTEEEQLLPLLRAGARGYLAKNAAERDLVDAIRVVMAGDVFVRPVVARMLATSSTPADAAGASAREKYALLSDRERTVLRMVAEGYNGPEIGEQLGITAKTVDTYKQRIEDKLGLEHRTAYVRFAIDAGLLER